ncbi:MAG: hypothetical protein GY792_02605, partial [Gammaproteobacteria bacterium]|nr:hypothetical protein [Gammaproteobacteria bacterium]
QLGDGSLANGQVDPEVEGSTGTGLDQIIDMINADTELSRRISNEDIREAGSAADGMNIIIAEAIQQTGLGNDGEISASDVFDLNTYIRQNYEEEWVFLHGDDEGQTETGFHRVQNNGAVTRMFDENAINTVADGLYHMGFEIRNGRFLNEDGNANASVEQVAVWLDSLLEEDLALVISGGADTGDITGMAKAGGVDQPDYTTPYTDALAMATIANDDGAIDVGGVINDSALYSDTL